MDCSISAVYLYEIAVWCCHLSSLAYDSVQKRANFLMNLGCSLGAEAAALVGGDDSELSREERARRALKCDCVAELRDGPCGSQFKEAFYCFLTSTAEEQGSDCTKSFIAMQTCMTANPESFAQYNGEDRNQSSPGGEFTLHGNKQEGTPVASPPPGAIRKPL